MRIRFVQDTERRFERDPRVYRVVEQTFDGVSVYYRDVMEFGPTTDPAMKAALVKAVRKPDTWVEVVS